MKSVPTLNKKIIGVVLAVFVSLTFSGCQDQGEELSPEQAEKELDANFEKEMAQFKSIGQKYNKVVDDAKAAGTFKEGGSFSQALKDACNAIDKEDVQAGVDLKKEKIRIRNKIPKSHEGDAIHLNGVKKRATEQKLVIAEKESGCLRCHAAAEGLDISFMSPADAAAESKGKFTRHQAGDAMGSIFAFGRWGKNHYDELIDRGRAYVAQKDPKSSTCQGVKDTIADHSKRVERRPDFENMRDSLFGKIHEFFDRLHQRCIDSTKKTGAVLEIPAHHHSHGRSRQHSHHILEVDGDEDSAHSRASRDGNAIV